MLGWRRKRRRQGRRVDQTWRASPHLIEIDVMDGKRKGGHVHPAHEGRVRQRIIRRRR